MNRCLLLASLLTLAVACSKPAPPARVKEVGQTETATPAEAPVPDNSSKADEPAEVAQKQPDRCDNPGQYRGDRTLYLAGWPGSEELHTFELTAVPGTVDLYDCVLGKPIRTVEVKGGPLPWQMSCVHVLEPRALTAKTDVEFPQAAEVTLPPVGQACPGAKGAPPSAPHSPQPSRETTPLKIRKGATVGLWSYEGEGTCMIAAEHSVYQTACPSPQEFEGFAPSTTEVSAATMTPKARVWWVYVETDDLKGWLKVDGDTIKAKTVAPPPPR